MRIAPGSAWKCSDPLIESGEQPALLSLFSPSVSDDEIQGIHSLMTIVDGKIVYVDKDAGFSPDAVE